MMVSLSSFALSRQPVLNSLEAEEQAIKARLKSKEVIFEKAVRKFVAFSKQPDATEAFVLMSLSLSLFCLLVY